VLRSARRQEISGGQSEGGMDGYPVSVKGVVVRDGRVLLLHNERDEWELPGGRLEVGETPEQCVAREVAEETGWAVRTGAILDSWLYYIAPADKHVFIVTYGCHLEPGQETTEPILSHEHGQVGLFTRDEVADLVMPQGYQDSITRWFALGSATGGPDPVVASGSLG
jgi:8-oxo-dGTP pyrophosphatase MutT (NUDIX family)